MPSACSQCGPFVIPPGDRFELTLKTALRTLARFAELLVTNEAPRELELALIKPIAEATSARLASLDAEIARLEERVRELSAERTALSKYHAHNTRILSPVRRIPVEILSEIFLWASPSVYDVFDPEGSPWTLTHVCAKWRAIALSKPSLWSLINVDFSVSAQYPLELITIRMERAQALGIHFFGSEDGDSATQIDLFNLLAECSDRWEELSVKLTSHLTPCMTTAAHDLTRLCRAVLHWDTDESQTQDAVDFFRTAFSLADITVCSQSRFVPTRLPPLHQLTQYDLDGPWETHSQLLKSLPLLEEVRIRCFCDDDEDWPQPGEPIDVLNLRRLFVTDPNVMDYLRAPGLHEIGMIAVSPECMEPLGPFLLRSASSPHRLGIQGAFHAISVAEILQQHRSITELVVTPLGLAEHLRSEVFSAFLAPLTISQRTPPAQALPHVSHIAFGFQDADITGGRQFVNMLESRWNAGDCALKTAELLFLKSSPRLDPQSVARMEMLRMAGLQISVLSGRDATERITRWTHRTEWG
ncbi:hypothetical protein C8R45DRAFT_1148600 [Mycena sanguinolenta]|nr:hypothetical protein C8R45DRAFT_1148600 [Mycena sanguinolenta]